MNSALCTLFLFLASSLILFHAESAANDIVSDTCQKSAASSPNVNYDYCVKALGSDPKSRTADVQGLGLIALNLLESSVTSTGSDIQHQKKRFSDVQNSVSAVCTDATTCESQFKEKKGVTSPLTKQNGDATQLSYIELAILAIVKGS